MTYKKLHTTTCIVNYWCSSHSENPADFPNGSFSFIILDLAYVTNHTRTRYLQAEKNNRTLKNECRKITQNTN